MQALLDFIQAVLQTARDSISAHREPFGENGKQWFDLGFAIGANHVEINAVITLKVGTGKQMAHHRLDINTVRAQL